MFVYLETEQLMIISAWKDFPNEPPTTPTVPSDSPHNLLREATWERKQQ